MSQNNSIKTLPNLTPLRFFLALLVILFHVHQFCLNRNFAYFNSWPILNKGTESVYTFFILSGFLIIRGLYFEKKESNKISIKNFYLKRCLRILPLYYLVLVIGLIYYRFLLPKFGFDTNLDYDMYKAIFLSTTLFANIFATYGPGGIIEILWSIAVEEQFYFIVAPALFLVKINRYLKLLLAFTIVYFGVYFYSSITFFRSYNMLFFYFTIGGIAGILLNNSNIKAIVYKLRYIIYLATFIYFFTNYFINYLNSPIYNAFSAMLLTAFILTLSLFPIKFLEKKTFYFLGNISYGMYMLHAMVMQLVGFIFIKELIVLKGLYFIITFNILVVLGTIIFATIINKYFESYFMKLRLKLIK